MYVEVEGALYVGGGASGDLREGTGDGGADVWPGAWTFDKRRAVGFDVRVGYVPGALDFAGLGRSVYTFAGARRLDVDITAAHRNDRLGVAGARRRMSSRPRFSSASA